MKQLINSIILIGGIIGQVFARKVQFSVISFGADVKLNVGGNPIQMNKPDPTIPYWTVTTEVPNEEIR